MMQLLFCATGYCCKSLIKSKKYLECKTATVCNHSRICSSFNNNYAWLCKQIFDDINQSGLWKPTTELHGIVCLCWKIFAELYDSDKKKSFFRAENQ